LGTYITTPFKYFNGHCVNNHFDVVIVNYVFFSKAFLAFDNTVKKIIYTHDIFSNRFQKTGNNWFSTKVLQEAKALNRSDVIWSIQEQESVFFRSISDKKVVTTFCNFTIQDTEISGSRNILFLAGSNDHNVEAINFFIGNVLPLLVNEIVDIQLLVGGRICEKLEYAKCLQNVTLLGDVDDLHAFYSLGDIFINPTFNGTGLKIKTFEAMSFGKVVVTHQHNVLGIYKQEIALI
jgi:glycosyltransferase involved in cell wall biosynthesis